MPAAAHHNDHRRAVLLPRLRLGLLADQHLDRAPLLVETVELSRERARFLRVGAGEETNAEVGFADLPAGVDPGPERKAEVAAARRLHQPRRFGERGQADVLARGHYPQALGHEGAVEALQPGDIGDGAERNEIEQVEHPGLGKRFE